MGAFQVDLSSRPSPITVSVGAASFELEHAWMDAHERSRVIDAIEMGLESAMRVAFAKITGWQGVVGPDGAPLPFKVRDAEGRETSNLEKVLARIPYLDQLVLFFSLLAANGVRFVRMEASLAPHLEDPSQAAQIVRRVDDFFRSRGATPAAPATPSPSGAILPGRSA